MNWRTASLKLLHSGLSHFFLSDGHSGDESVLCWTFKLSGCLASCIYPVKASLGNANAFVGQTMFTVCLSALELLCCVLLLYNNGQIQFIT